MLTKQPEHIKPEWMRVAARLQGMQKQHLRSSAIYKFTILVGADGLPHFYMLPRVILLEPKNVMILSRLRKILEGSGLNNNETKEQIAEILELME